MAQQQRLKDCEDLASRLHLNVRKHRKKLLALSELLSEDEELLSLTTGVLRGNIRENVIALTAERPIILKDDANDAVEHKLADIAEVKGKRGIGGGRVDLLTAGSILRFNNVHKASTDPFLTAARDAVRLDQTSDTASAVLDPLRADFRDENGSHTQTTSSRAHVIASLEAKAAVAKLPLNHERRQMLHAVAAMLTPEEELIELRLGKSQSTPDATLVALTNDRLIIFSNDEAETHSFRLHQITLVDIGEGGELSRDIKIQHQGKKTKLRVWGKVDSFVEAFVNATSTEGNPTLIVPSTVAAAPDYQPVAIKTLNEREREAVYEKLFSTIGGQWIARFRAAEQLQQLPRQLMDDELLLWLAAGQIKTTGKELRGDGSTLIALTDRRILLLERRFPFGARTVSIDLDRISAVSGDKGLVFGNVTIRDTAEEHRIGDIRNSAVPAFVDRAQSAIQDRKRTLANQNAKAISAASTSPTDPASVKAPVGQLSEIDQLEKLANLLDRGILTPEEFAEQKAKLLNG